MTIPSRDRRGRGRRGPLAWPPVPAMVTRSAAFDDLVVTTTERFRSVLGRYWQEVEFAVQDVPPLAPTRWEQGVALARVFPASGRHPTRVVLYRRPIESLVQRGDDIHDVVYEVLVEQVALILGVDADDVDDAVGGPGR
ncbi:metallopeptidase family protein [Janibacter sp. GXQ6167]|uniref:metallopeptidase family protein n=1 Tax=Janibacter sp. GXQ6167 TaxID=3240791 RepID=UPI0035266901